MGNGINIKCECGEVNYYLIGGGELPQQPFVYDSIMKDESYADIRKYVSSPADIGMAYQRLYYCRNCRTLKDYQYFRLNKKPDYILKRYCPECHKRMVHIENESKIFSGEIKINCPKCKAEIIPKEDFSNISDFLWD